MKMKLSHSNFKRLLFFVIILQLSLSSTYAVSRYLRIDRRLYRHHEYQFIMADSLLLFVLNQPYTESQLSEYDKNLSSKRLASYRARNLGLEDGISILIKPGWQFQKDSDLISNPSTTIDGYFQIDNLIGVNRLFASKQITSDPDYHGDKSEWISAYMQEAYLRYIPSPKLSFFGGRTARNYGIPNEYGLFLSDNPYPYDHFGFSAASEKFQFSWYFGRLNNMRGYDDQGRTIPLGKTLVVQRYMAYQRLDWKINERLQLGLSEATLYGGPNQGAVAAYLNPLNFYYLSQRNQRVQMNGSWQINLFYYVPQKWAAYLDFYIDDFIINNDEGVDDRAAHPDRLAIMSKISVPDFLIPQSLSSLRYVRVWNETYVSYRNFENWVYFDKGLGFPERAYEGLKLESSYLGSEYWQMALSLETWRRGKKSLFTTLVDEANVPFPASPITNGLSAIGNLQTFYKRFDLELEFKVELLWLEGSEAISNYGFNMGVNYGFNLGLME
jgi:hypothetical protein